MLESRGVIRTTYSTHVSAASNYAVHVRRKWSRGAYSRNATPMHHLHAQQLLWTTTSSITSSCSNTAVQHAFLPCMSTRSHCSTSSGLTVENQGHRHPQAPLHSPPREPPRHSQHLDQHTPCLHRVVKSSSTIERS